MPGAVPLLSGTAFLFETAETLAADTQALRNPPTPLNDPHFNGPLARGSIAEVFNRTPISSPPFPRAGTVRYATTLVWFQQDLHPPAFPSSSGAEVKRH